MAYRMAPLPVTFNDTEGHFCCLKPFCLTYFGKDSAFYLQYVYTLIGKRMWLVILTTLSKTKGFPRSQPVTDTVNVIISQKRFQIESMLPHTTNEVIYGLLNRGNSDDLESPLRLFLTASLSNVICTTRRYASAVYAVSCVRCPSVYLSVTSSHCCKMNERRITQRTILVF